MKCFPFYGNLNKTQSFQIILSYNVDIPLTASDTIEISIRMPI